MKNKSQKTNTDIKHNKRQTALKSLQKIMCNTKTTEIKNEVNVVHL